MIEQYRNPGTKVKKIIFILLAVVLILFIWYQWSVSSSSLVEDSENLFVVESGESAGQIADRLQVEGFITSARAFNLFIWLNNKTIYLGCHLRLADAINARKKAELTYHTKQGKLICSTI